MSQSHLAIDFPIKTPADAKALTQELPPLMAEFAKAQDKLGTVHFSRFMIEGGETLLFLSIVDGDVDNHLNQLVESARPVFDTIFKHVQGPPAANDFQAIITWLKQHNHKPMLPYGAFEDASVQDIKAAAGAAGFTGNTRQNTWLIYAPVKSSQHALALKENIRATAESTHKMSDSIGTLHFAGLVAFGDTHAGFFTIYDGDFAQYIQDFTDKIGPVFDSFFEYIKNPPPVPVRKNAQAFLKWAGEANHTPIGFYSAYPGLGVQDVRALLADRKS